MSNDNDKYANQRQAVQNEINKSIVNPLSHEVFAKSKEEKLKLKELKANCTNK